MELKHITPAEITPDTMNANEGTERGAYMIAQSLSRFGAGRSIVVDKHGRIIAGEHVFQQAADLDLDMVEVETDGNTLVVVKRTDLDFEEDDRARGLSIADNRAAQVGIKFDPEVLIATSQQMDISDFFREEELKKIEREFAQVAELALTVPQSNIDSPKVALDKKDIVTSGNTSVPASQVRMVQLYYNGETYAQFTQYIEALKERYVTTNTSDTMLQALKEAYENHSTH